MAQTERTRQTAFDIDVAVGSQWNLVPWHQMKDEVDSFIRRYNLEDDRRYIRAGAFLVQTSQNFDYLKDTGFIFKAGEEQHLADEKVKPPTWKDWSAAINVLSFSRTWQLFKKSLKRWKQPWRMWNLVLLCALGACVQGWDESAVNGAQIFYNDDFELQTFPSLRGIINGAPYLCCFFSCWLTSIFSPWMGRRAIILLASVFSVVSCTLQGAHAWNWQTMLVYRFLLGFGVGPKSAIIPIYASECVPANIRGSLVMLWQMFTALGIMFGNLFGVIFNSVQVSPTWRFTIASPMAAPIILIAYILTQPESPRWLLQQAQAAEIKAKKAQQVEDSGRSNYSCETSCKYVNEAYKSLRDLRPTKLQAARDFFEMYHSLKKEQEVLEQMRKKERIHKFYQKGVFELWKNDRSRRAFLSSLIVMFAQQACGINLFVYYSSTFFQEAHYSIQQSLWFSFGFGLINFVFAFPAFWTIDTFGRRKLLLYTFPFLALFQFTTMISFTQETNSATAAVIGMYLFTIPYSIGEGPVPFVYAAESMPLWIRDLGMGLVTSLNWLLNFVVAFTAPPLSGVQQWLPFAIYACLCCLSMVLIYFFVPETKGKKLEGSNDMDSVFDDSWRHTLGRQTSLEGHDRSSSGINLEHTYSNTTNQTRLSNRNNNRHQEPSAEERFEIERIWVNGFDDISSWFQGSVS